MQVLELENGIRKKSNSMVIKPSSDLTGGSLGFNPSLLDRMTYLDYKVDLYHSDFAYLFYDSFVTEEYTELGASDVVFNDDYSISGKADVETQFFSINYTLGSLQNRCMMKIKGEGNLGDVTILISFDDGVEFYRIFPNEDMALPEETSQFRVGFMFPAGTDAKISDYGLYIGTQTT